jgi:hypothetical protein
MDQDASMDEKTGPWNDAKGYELITSPTIEQKMRRAFYRVNAAPRHQGHCESLTANGEWTMTQVGLRCSAEGTSKVRCHCMPSMRNR